MSKDDRWQFSLDVDHKESDRRVALANWLTDPENPLVWRSIVNRIWHYHFGRGIVGTPNDFGRMGAKPTIGAIGAEDRVDLVEADYTEVEFGDDKFDLVLMANVLKLHRIEQRSSLLERAFASLRSGGELAVVERDGVFVSDNL